MTRQLIVCIFLSLTGLSAFGQTPELSGMRYFRQISDKDTSYYTLLPEVNVRASKNDYLKNLERCRKYVQRTYELAMFVSSITKGYNDSIGQITRKKARRDFLKSERKKLFEEFTGVITAMNQPEGKVFLKLVYRESGMTTYDMIKQFQGGVKAMLWQTLSRTGGADLKIDYDPDYTDKVIEDVLKEVAEGKLKPHPLPHSKEEYKSFRRV